MATARDRHYYTRYAASARIVVAGLAPAMQKKDGHPRRSPATRTVFSEKASSEEEEIYIALSRFSDTLGVAS
jgi:hypothetical protein